MHNISVQFSLSPSMIPNVIENIEAKIARRIPRNKKEEKSRYRKLQRVVLARSSGEQLPKERTPGRPRTFSTILYPPPPKQAAFAPTSLGLWAAVLSHLDLSILACCHPCQLNLRAEFAIYFFQPLWSRIRYLLFLVDIHKLYTIIHMLYIITQKILRSLNKQPAEFTINFF